MSKSINPMCFLKPGAKLFALRPGPIVSMSLQTAIPRRFALQHGPPPLHRPVSIFRPPQVICQPVPSGKYQSWTRRPRQGTISTSGVGQIRVSKWARPEYQTQRHARRRIAISRHRPIRRGPRLRPPISVIGHRQLFAIRARSLCHSQPRVISQRLTITLRRHRLWSGIIRRRIRAHRHMASIRSGGR